MSLASSTGGLASTDINTSAKIAAIVSDETGSGALVFANTPTLTTPNIGVASGTSLTISGADATANVIATTGSGGITFARSGATGSWIYPGDGRYQMRNDGFIGWSSSTNPANTADLTLYRHGANALAVRNSTNAQTLYVDNTFTSTSNFESFRVQWSSNVCYIGPTTTGGTQRLPVEDGAASKSLTESTATAFVRVAVASGSDVGGCIRYRVHADDGTDFQSRTGTVNFAIVNKAGTLTANLGTVINEAAALSAGTLAVTFDTNSGAANTMDIRANAVSSLTQTTLKIDYRVEIFGPTTTITPQ